MKKFISLLVIITIILSSIPCYAYRGGHHYSRRGPVHHGGHRGNGALWGVLAGAVVAGAIISSLPPRRDIIVVNGENYYYDGRYYYRARGSRYVIVDPPVVVNPTVVVKVMNSNGSYTEIVMTQRGDLWVGPRGEIYNDFPTTEQLRTMYGN